jgi:hypothetical protein
MFGEHSDIRYHDGIPEGRVATRPYAASGRRASSGGTSHITLTKHTVIAGSMAGHIAYPRW